MSVCYMSAEVLTTLHAKHGTDVNCHIGNTVGQVSCQFCSYSILYFGSFFLFHERTLTKTKFKTVSYALYNIDNHLETALLHFG